jgi:hypothetical protein
VARLERATNKQARGSRAVATSVLTVHLVETLAELVSLAGTACETDIIPVLDHVVLVDRHSDGVPALLPPHRRLRSQATSKLVLPESDRRIVRRYVMGPWTSRVSRVLVVDRPFSLCDACNDEVSDRSGRAGDVTATPPPAAQASEGTGPRPYHNRNQDGRVSHKEDVPTFVCHQYDPRSIRQVARILIQRATMTPTATALCGSTKGPAPYTFR